MSIKTFLFSTVLLASSVAKADLIFFSDFPGGTIYRIDGSGSPTVFASTGVNQTLALAVDRTGNLYAAGYATGNIIKYDPTGNATLFYSGLVNPLGLAIDSAGNLFAGNYGNGTITRIDPQGHGRLFATQSQVSGVAVDQNDNLYASRFNAVIKYDSQGIGTTFATNGVTTAVGLAFDKLGNLFLSNDRGGQFSTNNITKYDTLGQPSLFAAVGATSIVGLAFDSSGSLYAAVGTSIDRFDAAGNATVFVGGLSSPRFIAIESIPEPSPTGLLVAFLYLLWFRKQRRPLTITETSRP